jgi:hypothetical protein
MRNARSLLAALAILAMAALAYPPAAIGADQDARVVFTNGLSYAVEAKIYFAKRDKLQKAKTIAAGASHTFTIGAGAACSSKTREFTIRRASDAVDIADGSFSFRGFEIGNDCRMELRVGERLLFQSLDDTVRITGPDADNYGDTRVEFRLKPGS